MDGVGARGFVRGVVVFGVVLFGVGGVWAFGWPHGFFSVIADYPPYNRHLFHDLGAFQIAIAVGLGAGLVWRDALLVGLMGGAAGMVVHAVSHVIDHGLGGAEYDMWGLLALALVFVAAVWVRMRQVGGGGPGRSGAAGSGRGSSGVPGSGRGSSGVAGSGRGSSGVARGDQA